MTFLLNIKHKLCCQALQIQDKFNSQMKALQALIQTYQTFYCQVQYLKAQRHQRVDRNFRKSHNPTTISTQQVHQYMHLDKLGQQMKKQCIQRLKILKKRMLDVQQLALKNDQIQTMQKVMKQTQEIFKQIQNKVNTIKRGKSQYTSDQSRGQITYKNVQNNISQSIGRLDVFKKQIQTLQQRVINVNKSSLLQIKQVESKYKQYKKQQVEQKLSQQAMKYIKTVIKIKNENQAYHKLSIQEIKYCKDQFDVKFTPTEEQSNLCKLNHSFINIQNMEAFSSILWGSVCYMNLVKCGIDDNKWKQFTDNAKSFPELKILWLSQNKLDKLVVSDLAKFNKLQFVYFQENPCGNSDQKRKKLASQLVQVNKQKRVNLPKLSIYL